MTSRYLWFKITCLIEVNDGYSLGRYEPLTGKDYFDLLAARWQSLVSEEKKSS